MVKGEQKSSRIFQQCYVKCCKLQNLTPLTAVLPSGNGKVLDFCVDRIKYADWPPILNAISCDLSLHSVAIRCRQQVKTVLEQIDCERLAKTVNKRAVILTNFMLSNCVEALAQLLSNSTLLYSLLLEGLPLKIPYLNPLNEALLQNSSLQHLHLPRCLIGDAGCLALCKSVRNLPNLLTMDLSGCELTLVGAGYITDLLKYQKIHRYSENWVHTLRYRLPELDAMAGLRRLTLCGNTQLGDAGAATLFNVLADDLWIKALDVQNCGLTEVSAMNALQMMTSNTTLVVLDLRHNVDVTMESLSKIRAALRENERRRSGECAYSWLSNVSGCSGDGRSSVPSKNGIIKDRGQTNTRSVPSKYSTKTYGTKKEKDYTEVLEEQLQEEILHRQQLEELNLQLVNQMKQLKEQQMQLWANNNTSSVSGSEQSFTPGSAHSYNLSSSSGGSCSVSIDQNTLSYIQYAFRDIYTFIKNNQCTGQCQEKGQGTPPLEMTEILEVEEIETDFRINIAPKKAQSTHDKITENTKMKKTTKSAHLLMDKRHKRDGVEMKKNMYERQMGDTKSAHDMQQSIIEDVMTDQKSNKNSNNKGSPCDSVSDSSETLVCSPSSLQSTVRACNSFGINPREALYSSSSEDSS